MSLNELEILKLFILQFDMDMVRRQAIHRLFLIVDVVVVAIVIVVRCSC